MILKPPQRVAFFLINTINAPGLKTKAEKIGEVYSTVSVAIYQSVKPLVLAI